MGKTYLFRERIRPTHCVPSIKVSRVHLEDYGNFASIFPGDNFENVHVAEEAKTAKFRPGQSRETLLLWLCWNVEGMSLNIACLKALTSLHDRVAGVHYSVIPNPY